MSDCFVIILAFTVHDFSRKQKYVGSFSEKNFWFKTQAKIVKNGFVISNFWIEVCLYITFKFKFIQIIPETTFCYNYENWNDCFTLTLSSNGL